MSKKLPEPDCRFGYSVEQVKEIMGGRFDEFTHWMRGQTMSICDGTIYDYGKKMAVPSGCAGPHSTVIYAWDVERFLEGRPIVD